MVRYLPFLLSMIIPQTFQTHSSVIQETDNKPVRGLRSTFIQPQYALRLKEIVRLLTKISYATNTLTKILYATKTKNGFACKGNLIPVQLCNTEDG
jgi:diaminopimelate decarboxylase